MDRVCSSCFSDADIRRWVRDIAGPRGCDFCKRYDSPTVDFEELCDFIEQGLRKFWGLAVEQLPFESAEGGYQGQTWDTREVLFDEEGLDLPRDDGTLHDALLNSLPDELWCHYDWLTLDDDVALATSWERFCETVKHERRFFFHRLGGGPDDRDSYSSEALLQTIARHCERLDLVRMLPANTRLWRARPDISPHRRVGASDFGPPPKKAALQSNRMNPPGVPMMYAASTAQTAKAETRASSAAIGLWTTNRPARVLDLRNLPGVPGTFSDASRADTLAMRFLDLFADDIVKPVERDERVHIDYLPSQVVTEYLRDFAFDSGPLDGIAYGSSVRSRGWNVALFVDAIDLGLGQPDRLEARSPWLTFKKAIRL